MTCTRDTFCSFCGTRYSAAGRYPRSCPGCKTQVWANPVPVSVVLVLAAWGWLLSMALAYGIGGLLASAGIVLSFLYTTTILAFVLNLVAGMAG